MRKIAAMTPHLMEAARRFGTPAYVVDAPSLAAAAKVVEAAFPAPWVRQYSLKANDLPAVVAFLARRGWGANVVSHGECGLARAGGVPTEAVTFEGIGKTDEDLEQVVEHAARGHVLRWLAVESPEEAETLREMADAAGLGTGDRPALPVLLRLNPHLDAETMPVLAVGGTRSKFGMDEVEILSVVRSVRRDPGVVVRGIHVHVGSDLRDVNAWADAGTRAVRLLTLLSPHVDSADTVDFGGGFPAFDPHGPAPAQFRDALLDRLDRARAGARGSRGVAGHPGPPLPAATAARPSGRARRGHDRADPPCAVRRDPPPPSAARPQGPRTSRDRRGGAGVREHRLLRPAPPPAAQPGRPRRGGPLRCLRRLLHLSLQRPASAAGGAGALQRRAGAVRAAAGLERLQQRAVWAWRTSVRQAGYRPVGIPDVALVTAVVAVDTGARALPAGTAPRRCLLVDGRVAPAQSARGQHALGA